MELLCGCSAKHYALGLCAKHWRAQQGKKKYIKTIYDDRRIFSRYKISLEEFNFLKSQNNYCCYLCGEKPKRLLIDHDHKTGDIRGLLCDGCNTGIWIVENISREILIDYLSI